MILDALRGQTFENMPSEIAVMNNMRNHSIRRNRLYDEDGLFQDIFPLSDTKIFSIIREKRSVVAYCVLVTGIMTYLEFIPNEALGAIGGWTRPSHRNKGLGSQALSGLSMAMVSVLPEKSNGEYVFYAQDIFMRRVKKHFTRDQWNVRSFHDPHTVFRGI